MSKRAQGNKKDLGQEELKLSLRKPLNTGSQQRPSEQRIHKASTQRGQEPAMQRCWFGSPSTGSPTAGRVSY
ncbi:unnamed protein product [Gadus morhua 'NCC']